MNKIAWVIAMKRTGGKVGKDKLKKWKILQRMTSMLTCWSRLRAQADSSANHRRQGWPWWEWPGAGSPGKAGHEEHRDGEQKASRADGEGVKIDQRAGSSVIATWHSSQTRIKHYLCSFAFLGCQEVNGNPPAAQLCLAALVPRNCCHRWALLEPSCMKGAQVSLSVLLVLNCTCICSML